MSGVLLANAILDVPPALDEPGGSWPPAPLTPVPAPDARRRPWRWALGLLGASFAASEWSDLSHSSVAGAVSCILMLASVATLGACFGSRGVERSERLGSPRFWFWFVELSLVAAFLALQFNAHVWEWWRHGERFTGVIVEVHVPDEDRPEIRQVTIQDPEKERAVKVWVEDESMAKGATANAVILRRDPTKVETPEDLRTYLACWTAAAVFAVLWPLGFWQYRRHTRRASDDPESDRARLRLPANWWIAPEAELTRAVARGDFG